MIDILFVELGAVVTEVLGPSRCTIEPFCDPAKPPTFAAERRIEIDFAHALESILAERGGWTRTIAMAAREARYDVLGYGSPPIGPSWPGGGYEGVVTIREDLVRASAALAEAAASLPGHPWEHQVIASIDEETGSVRRYHGFHAELAEDAGAALVLRVFPAGASDDASAAREVRYVPADRETFHAGELVADRAVAGGRAPRRAGAVFMTPEAAARAGLDLPKLPPGAGL